MHDEAGAPSYIDAKDVRHPIIERIQEQVDYVSNDVRIGEVAGDQGILLYGINASGKSSYMKAIGLNLIMAQAGMFVAATEFRFAPFSHLFTRICNTDNIYRGLSSFTVEMTELCNILQRCDARSLVLGDEICAGTESVSGLAIVCAGIRHLLSQKSCFVFATHLHELTDLKELQQDMCGNAKCLGVYHMHIEIEKETHKIVYERKIRPGRGMSVYGLEVCAALGMPKEFMEVAHRVRREVQQVNSHIVRPKTSRYNAQVVMDTCKVCGKKASDTHHIRYQMTANEEKFVDQGISVNRASNLMPLCEECHNKEHQGELCIEGYVQTSQGVEAKVVKRPVQRLVLTVEEIPAKWKGTLVYDLSGWKQKSETTQKWKVISEDTIRKKLHKLLGQEVTDDELIYLRNALNA
jgi:DNA mismatch repair protein MutS